jgi:hypothetical protein
MPSPSSKRRERRPRGQVLAATKSIENLNRVVAETVRDGFDLPLPEPIP